MNWSIDGMYQQWIYWWNNWNFGYLIIDSIKVNIKTLKNNICLIPNFEVFSQLKMKMLCVSYTEIIVKLIILKCNIEVKAEFFMVAHGNLHCPTPLRYVIMVLFPTILGIRRPYYVCPCNMNLAISSVVVQHLDS